MHSNQYPSVFRFRSFIWPTEFDHPVFLFAAIVAVAVVAVSVFVVADVVSYGTPLCDASWRSDRIEACDNSCSIHSSSK